MAYLFPAGVSALIDPDDEAHLAFLELCAEVRRRLGQPSYTRADLERLFALKDVAAPEPPRSDKVVPLAAYARRRRRRMQF